MTITTRYTTALVIGATLVTSGCASKGGSSKVAAGEVATPAAAPSASAASSMLSGALGPASALIGSLSSAIPGLSQAQAILGAGSLFGLAKAKMPADQFSQVANAVPGSQALVDEAVKGGLPAADQLTGSSSLKPVFEKAGISAEMANKLVPLLGEAVSKGGGKPLADAFLAAVR